MNTELLRISKAVYVKNRVITHFFSDAANFD